jgi:hypothetical protein
MWTPDPSKIITAEQKAAAVAEETTRGNRRKAISDDAGRVALMDRLKAATPAQIDAYVDSNVTTIAHARTMFKAILKLIALDARD